MTSEMDIRTAAELIGEDAVKRLNENNLYVVHSRTLDKMASISSELIQLQKENKDLLRKLHRAQRREEGLEIQNEVLRRRLDEKPVIVVESKESPSWLRIGMHVMAGVTALCTGFVSYAQGWPIWSSLVLVLCGVTFLFASTE